MSRLMNATRGDKHEIQVPRNKWGWPLVPCPSDPSDRIACQRPSSFGKKITDDYNIKQWILRCVAKGAGLRPDLATMAATLDVTDDKQQLQRLADQMKDAAGGAKGANTGTAIHTVLEKTLRGEPVDIPPVVAGPAAAMLQMLERYDISVVDGLIEPFIICEEIPAAGSADAFVKIADRPSTYVFDLKTGATSPTEFSSPLEYGVQLAIYAHCTHQWGGTGTDLVVLPEIDQEVGYILWVPSDHPTGYAELIEIDLVESWKMVHLAMEVTQARRDIKRRFVMRNDFMPVSLEEAPKPDPEPSAGELHTRLSSMRRLLTEAVAGTGTDKAEVISMWPAGVPGLTPERFPDHTPATVKAVEAFVAQVCEELGWVFVTEEEIEHVTGMYDMLDDVKKEAIEVWRNLEDIPNIRSGQARKYHYDRAVKALTSALAGEEISG